MRLWVFISVIFLAGCKLGPEFETPTMDLPVAFENAQVQQPYMQDEIRWWKHFKDPILDDLIEKTVAANYDIKSAISKIQSARAEVGGTVANLFPQVDTVGSASRNKNSSNAVSNPLSSGFSGKPFNNYQAGFTAVWQLDLFGRVLSAIEASEANLELNLDEARGVMITLLADAAQTYMNLRGYQSQLEATKKNAELWDNIYKMNDDLFKAGVIATEIDVLQAKTNRDDALANIPTLEANIKTSMHHLAMLTGQNPTALYDLLKEHKPIPTIDEAIFAGLPCDLLQRRPDVRAAESKFAMANAEVGIAVGNLFPSLSLNGDYGWSSSKLSNLFSKKSVNYSYGPSFMWTIIDFGRLNSALDASIATRNAEFYTYKSTVLKAFEELENTLISYAKERERFLVLKDALEASKTAAELSLIRYQAGRISFIQTVQTEITYQLNIVAYIQSLVGRSNNAIAVYRALGGGWQAFDNSLVEQSERQPEVEH